MIKMHYDTKARKGQIICDPAQLSLVRGKFSVKNENAKFAKKFNRKIPDRKHAIDNVGRFDFGLYKEILQFLIDNQFINIEYTPEFTDALRCGISVDTVYNGFKYPHRDFQLEMVTLALKYGRGTLKSATGSGKSFCIASIIENFWRNRTNKTFKCFISVPGTSLVSQLQNDFAEYGVAFSYSGWTGKDELQNTEVVICNNQNLASKFDDNKWILDVDLLIVDECHGVKTGSELTKIISKIKTPNKFGLTGTFPRDQFDTWKIIGTFGPVLYVKTSKELRDENVLTDVAVKMIRFKHPKKSIPKRIKRTDKSPTEDYLAELSYIYNNESRNNFIKKIVSKLPNNTLVLVNHLEHAELLNILLSTITDKKTFLIKGDVEVSDRNCVIQELETNSNIVCVAMSSIFATGINIKNLHNIVFASGGKSFIRIIQGIGRGLRLHNSKQKLAVIDLSDNIHYSMDHAELRKQYYEDEQLPWKEIEIIL